MYKSLLNEKYTAEYKLDRHTKVKALDILNDYFRKNPEELTVSLSQVIDLLINYNANTLLRKIYAVLNYTNWA